MGSIESGKLANFVFFDKNSRREFRTARVRVSRSSNGAPSPGAIDPRHYNCPLGSRRIAIRRFGLGLACLLLCVGQPSIGRAATGSVPPRAVAPSDAEIRRILVDEIDVQEQGVGIVVGILDITSAVCWPTGVLKKTIPVS
jgi:hypothetical protein